MHRFTNNFMYHREKQFPKLEDVLTIDDIVSVVNGIMIDIDTIPRIFISTFIYDYFQEWNIVYSYRSATRWKREFLARLAAEIYDRAQLFNVYEFNPNDYMFNGYEQWVERDQLEQDDRNLRTDTNTTSTENKTSKLNIEEDRTFSEQVDEELTRNDDNKGTSKETDTTDFISSTIVNTRDNNVNVFIDHPMSSIPDPNNPPNHLSIPTNRTTNDATGNSTTNFSSNSEREKNNQYQDNLDREQVTNQTTENDYELTREENFTHTINNVDDKLHNEVENEIRKDDESIHTINTRYDVQDRLATSIHGYKELALLMSLLDALEIMFLTTSVDINYI